MLGLLLAPLTACVSHMNEEEQARKFREAHARGICPVHEVAMQKERLPIHYGIPCDLPDLQALQRFPFARRPILGGCVIHDRSPREEEGWVCPRCVEEEAREKASGQGPR